MKTLAYGAAVLFLLLPLRADCATPNSILGTEPNLDAPVTVRLRQAPLCDLAAQVARETGVPLATSEDTADERVTLFARERPAREVLARVAEHFDYSWVAETRQGKRTLVLTQDLAAKRRERALRGGPERDVDLWRTLLEGWVAKVGSPEVAALRRRPRAERIRRLQELEERLFGAVVPEAVGEDAIRRTRRQLHGNGPSPREKEQLSTERSLLLLVTPEAEGFNTLAIAYSSFEAMTVGSREALWRGERVTLAYPPERGPVPLLLAKAEELVAGGLGHLVDQGEEQYAPFHSVERVRVSLTLRPRGTEVGLSVRLRTVGSYGEGADRERVEWVHSEELRPRHMRVPRQVEQPLDASLRQWSAPVVLPPARKDEAFPSVTTPEFEDVLERLAAHVPEPILADAYHQGTLDGALTNGPAPLNQLLERVCRVSGRVCRLDRGYLTFRHQEWADKRAQEPPTRMVRRWQASIEKHGGLKFQDLVQIAATLTPDQAEVLKERLERRSRGVARLLETDLEQSGAVLRLLHSLPPRASAALRSGQSVTLGSLPGADLRLAFEFIDGTTATVHGYEDDENQDGTRYVPGTGFAMEDRLEAKFRQIRVRLRRAPARWVWRSMRWEVVESNDHLKRLLAEWEQVDPALKKQGMRLVEGEKVEVDFEMPGAEPVTHFFLDPLRQLPPSGRM